MSSMEQRQQLASRLGEILEALPKARQEPEMNSLEERFSQADLVSNSLDKSDPRQFASDLIETPEMYAHLSANPQLAQYALTAKTPEQFADQLL